jgi:hypothetical protein
MKNKPLCTSLTMFCGFLGKRQQAIEQMNRGNMLIRDWRKRAKDCPETKRCLDELLKTLDL